jgi:hypothetical protein|tara:strand:- start:4998 stop:5498 length:501 start_codon:yes stop_codon:yes gene_type:complete
MAHFVKLNSSKEVVKVHVVPNDACPNDTEEEGITYLNKVWSVNNVVWKKCSYNTHHNVHKLGGTPYRGNYPGVGYIYDEVNDIFLPPKPYDSWTLNVAEARWVAPVERPAIEYSDVHDDKGGMFVYWDEPNLRWIGYKGANATSGQAATDTAPYRWEPSNNTWILI